MDTKNITQKRCTNSATDYRWTHKIVALKNNTYVLLQVLVAATMLWSCCCKVDTPADTKYLADFHAVNFMETSDELPKNVRAIKCLRAFCIEYLVSDYGAVLGRNTNFKIKW